MKRAPKKQPLVLLVDDNADARDMYAEYFEYCGTPIVLAKDGFEAVDRALAVRPDVILMDLALPGMDGWEATRRIKADARTAHIPVVALTGHALEGNSQSAADAGCDGFVTKPCLPEDLLAEVRRQLRLHRHKGNKRARAQRRAENPGR